MSSLLRTCSGLDLIIKNNSVKDYFNISYYIGNSNVSSINTNFNMTSGHYLVKIKDRDNTFDHVLYDTKRGRSRELYTNKPASEINNINGLTSFNSNGFVLGNSKNVNNFNDNYVVTTIKQVEKFFDIVTYIGNGEINRSINHALNCDIGMISIKALDIYSNWIIRHKDATGELIGEQPYAQLNEFKQITEINNLSFKVSNNANLTGIRYVAYIYANDSSSIGKIQCGSYIGGYQEVNNTVTGIGMVLIPDDVNAITIIGKGGTGGSNVWYNPGKPYVPGTPEQKYIAPTYGWFYIDDYSITTQPITSLELWNSYNHTKPLQPSTLPTKVSDPNDPTTSVYVEWFAGTMDNPVFYKGHYSSYLVDVGQEFIAAVPEQLYTAPSSGGDVYSGNFSKVIVNDYTYVFEGGDAGPATPEIKNITLEPGINRTIKYNIAPGGSLTYNYKTGGETDVTIKFGLPSTTFTSNLSGNGSITIPKGATKIKLTCSGGIGTNDTFLVKPIAATPGVMINPGQPELPAKPAFPGQPYIAPSIITIPERIIPAGWRYTEWTSLGETYFQNIGITSEFITYDGTDYKAFNQGTSSSYRIYSNQPPGDPCYYDGTVVGGTTPVALAYVSTATQRTWARRSYNDSGAIIFTNVNHTWHAAETIPASTVNDPGQPELPPTPEFLGQPYIAPTYSVEPTEYFPGVYANPGQPYIAPTPYDPGQPEIVPVAGQEFIPAQAEVIGQGDPDHVAGLLPYIAAIPPTPLIPASTIPASWRYDDWDNYAPSYWSQYEITSRYLPIDQDNYLLKKDSTTGKYYKIFAHQPPGSDLFYTHNADGTAITGTPELAGIRSSETVVPNWPCQYIVGSTSYGLTMDLSWHEDEIIPEVPATTGTVGQGDPDHVAGLLPYIASKPKVIGQPYIQQVIGQPYIAPTPSSPGQPYVPPVIGVGDIVGPSSYVSINNQTFTFPGSMGYDAPEVASSVITLMDGGSKSFVYNIASSGSLNISYDIPNFDTITKPNFTPYYLLIKKVSGEGDWIEIDARKPLFNLKLNKSDIEVSSDIITIKDDGFIPKSILINEMNQKYVYVVIRK